LFCTHLYLFHLVVLSLPLTVFISLSGGSVTATHSLLVVLPVTHSLFIDVVVLSLPHSVFNQLYSSAQSSLLIGLSISNFCPLHFFLLLFLVSFNFMLSKVSCSCILPFCFQAHYTTPLPCLNAEQFSLLLLQYFSCQISCTFCSFQLLSLISFFVLYCCCRWLDALIAHTFGFSLMPLLPQQVLYWAKTRIRRKLPLLSINSCQFLVSTKFAISLSNFNLFNRFQPP
jgi:hypothetical protein